MSKVIFISDFHLGAGCIPDRLQHERMICSFLETIGKEAEHIYLLGDILDYWYEYKYVVPRGYIRFFGALAKLSDNGIGITWVTGNHDIWLFDYLSKEIGIEVVDSPYMEREIYGKHFLLCHGDRIGKQSFGFKLISRLFRSKISQKIYGAIHPRWTVPFAHRWSSSSRTGHNPEISDNEKYKDYILNQASEFIKDHKSCDFLIMGHHHVDMVKEIPGSHCQFVVLGDWIDKFTYAEFEKEKPNEIIIKKYNK